MDLLEIGSFQFENLVKNRIPFLLLKLGGDIDGVFPSYLQEQVHRQTLLTTLGEEIKSLQTQGSPKDQAIVVLDENGTSAKESAERIANAGYGNVYFLAGGASGLIKDLKP